MAGWIMNTDLRTIVAAKNVIWSREARWILLDPNVAMIDFGHPETDGEVDYSNVAIRFHVHTKIPAFQIEMAVESGLTRDKLPKTLGGFKTDVQQDRFRLSRWPWGAPATSQAQIARRNGRISPLQGGISISDQFRMTYGTLGGIVLDRSSGDPMILSNWHVLASGWHANPTHRIYQPGVGDGGRDTDAIATFTRHAMFHRIDAAVATLMTPRREYVSQQFELANSRATGVTAPRFGMQVMKSGRASGITRGVVESIASGPIKMRYQGGVNVIEPAFLIKPIGAGQNVSAPGDSGSIWFEESTMRAIGLHFAGSDQPESAVAIEMPAVLNALQVDLFL
jgi:hypothetical protein